MLHVSGQQPLILIVDDDERIIDDFCFYLTEAKFRVAAATTPAAALEQLDKCSPALIILDVVLHSDENAGFDLCRTIRSGGEQGRLSSFKAIPIIMLTARSSEPDRQEGLSAGASIYLTKPLRRGDLINHIKILLLG